MIVNNMKAADFVITHGPHVFMQSCFKQAQNVFDGEDW